jgi:hypothetical protein
MAHPPLPRRRDPADVIDHFVALVLGHIDKEYPHKLDHVMNDESQVKGPRALHPIFYGSFDWHSSVHGHWLLVRALLRYPKLAQRDEVVKILDARFTAENVKVETEYLTQKLRATFERTYGWAWLLKLAAELDDARQGGSLRVEDTPAPEVPVEMIKTFDRWWSALAPLTDAFVDRYIRYLPKATYPIRVGVHQNAAFGLALAWDYVEGGGTNMFTSERLKARIEEKARAWYLKDQNYHGWEPDGTDFISPGLMEAELMRRVLPRDEFLAWFGKFLPRLADKQPAAMFEPAFVSDRTDGQITHLDGLNLSRAWCFRSLGRALPEGDPRRAVFEDAYIRHLEAALPHVSGDYMGEHWLATFALLAMTE